MHRRPISGNSVAHSKYTDQENTARRGDHYGTIVCTFKITIIAFADRPHTQFLASRTANWGYHLDPPAIQSPP